MNLKRLVSFDDLNWWLVLSGMGSNLILTAIVALAANAVAARQGADSGATLSGIIMMLGTFLATFLTGFITGRMAQVNQTSYGIISCLGVVIIILLTAPPSVFTLIMLFMALAGGLNGGMLSVPRRRHSRQ